MLLKTDLWEIDDLCRETGVSVRSIRFYQQAGLFPAPRQRGKAAKYGEADANRLKLIRALQRQRRMPLAQIRLVLPHPDDHAEVSRLLDELAREDETSSVEYARSIRLRSEALPVPKAAPSAAFLRTMDQPRPAAPRQARWDRISLTPDIETHHQNRLLFELLSKAQELLHPQGDV